MSNDTKPPCAGWDAWLGPEVEGTLFLGEWTLFIRRGEPIDLLLKAEHRGHGKIRRLWFCKEFIQFRGKDDLLAILRRVQNRNAQTAMCFEIPAHLIEELAFLRPFGVFYVKLTTEVLRAGDHICVGPAYSDEAFSLGTGASVIPFDYYEDVNLS